MTADTKNEDEMMEDQNQDPVDERALEAAMETELRADEGLGAAAEFSELTNAPAEGQPAALSVLYGLTMPVAIELGRTRLSIQDILALGRGSVIQLDRLAGEPVDVFVGDRRFAEGEVVVVGEQFGVRVTRILGKGGDGLPEALA